MARDRGTVRRRRRGARTRRASVSLEHDRARGRDRRLAVRVRPVGRPVPVRVSRVHDHDVLGEEPRQRRYGAHEHGVEQRESVDDSRRDDPDRVLALARPRGGGPSGPAPGRVVAHGAARRARGGAALESQLPGTRGGGTVRALVRAVPGPALARRGRGRVRGLARARTRVHAVAPGGAAAFAVFPTLWEAPGVARALDRPAQRPNRRRRIETSRLPTVPSSSTRIRRIAIVPITSATTSPAATVALSRTNP